MFLPAHHFQKELLHFVEVAPLPLTMEGREQLVDLPEDDQDGHDFSCIAPPELPEVHTPASRQPKKMLAESTEKTVQRTLFGASPPKNFDNNRKSICFCLLKVNLFQRT